MDRRIFRLVTYVGCRQRPYALVRQTVYVSDGMAASCSYRSLFVSAETSSQSHPAADVSPLLAVRHLSGIVLGKSNVLGVSRNL